MHIRTLTPLLAALLCSCGDDGPSPGSDTSMCTIPAGMYRVDYVYETGGCSRSFSPDTFVINFAGGSTSEHVERLSRQTNVYTVTLQGICAARFVQSAQTLSGMEFATTRVDFDIRDPDYVSGPATIVLNLPDSVSCQGSYTATLTRLDLGGIAGSGG